MMSHFLRGNSPYTAARDADGRTYVVSRTTRTGEVQCVAERYRSESNAKLIADGLNRSIQAKRSKRRELAVLTMLTVVSGKLLIPVPGHVEHWYVRHHAQVSQVALPHAAPVLSRRI